jgi:hypothetical protein
MMGQMEYVCYDYLVLRALYGHYNQSRVTLPPFLSSHLQFFNICTSESRKTSTWLFIAWHLASAA